MCIAFKQYQGTKFQNYNDFKNDVTFILKKHCIVTNGQKVNFPLSIELRAPLKKEI